MDFIRHKVFTKQNVPAEVTSVICLISSPRSIVAVPTCQCLIQLQKGRRYFISVRAVNIGGPSDRSDVVTVSMKGKLWKEVLISISRQTIISWLIVYRVPIFLKMHLFFCRSWSYFPSYLPSSLCRHIILSPGGQCSSLPVYFWRWPFYFLWRRGVANQCSGFRWEHLLQVKYPVCAFTENSNAKEPPRDSSLCPQMHSRVREPDSSERPSLLGGPGGPNHRI